MGCVPGGNEVEVQGDLQEHEAFCADASSKRMKYDKKTGEYKECTAGDAEGPEDDFFAAEDAGEGEQFLSVKPWIGQIAEPDNHNPVSFDKPDETYALDYVLGYRCQDSRQNVHFNADGKVVYMTAALGVVLDHTQSPMTQQFFGGGEVDNTAKNVANDNEAHTDDITSLAMSECRTTCLTGQVGSKPAVFLWDACNPSKKTRVKLPRGSRTVSACGISVDGSRFAVADTHDNHKVHGFSSDGGSLFCEKGSNDKILDLAFNRAPGAVDFATAGRKHIAFWDADGKKKNGIFGDSPRTSFSCVSWDTKGTCYTGGANGKLYVWEGNTIKTVLDAHKGFICSCKCVGESTMVTGGYDGNVIVWDTSDMSQKATHTFEALVRAVDISDDGSKMVVGLRNGTIYFCDGDNKQEIMRSHSDGEVWGLQVDGDSIWTGGDDNKVMQWDPANHCCMKQMKVTDRSEKQRKGRGASTLSNLPQSQQCRCVATNDEYIAIAGNDGKVSIRAKSDPENEIKLLTQSAEWIECMSFSPDNTMFCVGSHDNHLYVYMVDGGAFSLKGKLVGHSSFIVAFDWCMHSKYIRSNCGAHEILYFTVEDCKQDTNGRSNTTSVEWATATVHFTWSNEAIFPKGTDGTHVNGVNQSPDGNTLLVGNDYGLVQLFRNPARNGAIPRSYRGHSEHVVRVAYSGDGSWAYSVGGYDQTLMIWKKQ